LRVADSITDSAVIIYQNSSHGPEERWMQFAAWFKSW
jgi:hypothetical protein